MIARSPVAVVSDPAKMTVDRFTIISMVLILRGASFFTDAHLVSISDRTSPSSTVNSPSPFSDDLELMAFRVKFKTGFHFSICQETVSTFSLNYCEIGLRRNSPARGNARMDCPVRKNVLLGLGRRLTRTPGIRHYSPSSRQRHVLSQGSRASSGK